MSATGFLDACGFIPASNGTGSFVVSSAITGYQTPASASAVNTTVYSYRAESADKSQWEEGFGAYTVSTTTLARSTITANSSGGATAISFSAAPNVFITAATADLQNAALLTSGTLPVARLNGGNANQFVQGDGTFQTQGRKLLNTLTATGTPSSLQDTTSITAAFSDYEIVFENLIPVLATGVTAELLVHTSSAFPSSGYLSSTILAGGAAIVEHPTTYIPLSRASDVASTIGFSGSIRLFNANNTASPKQWAGLISSLSFQNTGVHVLTVVGGYYNGGNTAIDGFQFLFSSGNITSGSIKIYGLN